VKDALFDFFTFAWQLLGYCLLLVLSSSMPALMILLFAAVFALGFLTALMLTGSIKLGVPCLFRVESSRLGGAVAFGTVLFVIFRLMPFVAQAPSVSP
jgi:hypothetical protein